MANLGYGSPDGMVWYGMVVSYLLLYLSSITLPAKFFAIASEIICFFVYISFSVCFCVSFICVIYSVYKLIMIITRLCIECKSSPRHLTSTKSDSGFESQSPDLSGFGSGCLPDLCQTVVD